jgi:Na+-translocating ferredoxin:NAD+ oxidoreductase RnfE subunit
MIKAARFYSIFLLLFAVGTFIAGIAGAAQLGAAGIMGAFTVPLLVGLPTIPALMALGKEKPRVEAFALFVNKAFLFLFAAAAIGFGFKLAQGPNPLYFELLVPGAIFALSFLLNAMALQKQKSKRATGA